MNFILSLIRATQWEFLLLARYQVVAMSFFIAGVYAALFFALDLHYDDLIILFVISDPVMMGFMFTGVLVLYDKNQNTMQAISVTSVNHAIKLGARALALTVLALICSFAIAIAGKSFDFNFLIFSLAVILSSILFYYIGIISLIGVSSFNGFLMRAVVYLIPFFIPLLELGDVYTNPLFYLIPTKAVLILFQASFESASTLDLIYAFAYQIILIVVIQIYAVKKYEKGEV
ncbi:MAG: hypothetical protein ABUK01_04365 [Leptospirales bacterium]